MVGKDYHVNLPSNLNQSLDARWGKSSGEVHKVKSVLLLDRGGGGGGGGGIIYPDLSP